MIAIDGFLYIVLSILIGTVIVQHYFKEKLLDNIHYLALNAVFGSVMYGSFLL